MGDRNEIGKRKAVGAHNVSNVGGIPGALGNIVVCQRSQLGLAMGMEVCPFDGKCYRLNPNHWKEMQHNKQSRPVGKSAADSKPVSSDWFYPKVAFPSANCEPWLTAELDD
eukprot:749176-Hanusia_phi.AAC.1